ncbi:MAG: DUF4830 domain-containing protein [Oscillospiraceae bacterium]|nr:DUF4830 domain-containing protein [Oscillospiraceae bacterium]
MLIVTAKLTKKKFALIFAAATLLLLGLLVLFSPQKAAPQTNKTPFTQLSTNEARLALLSSCGLEAIAEPITTLDLQLPSPLDERYAAYNQLQIPQGFDLTAYCGKNLTRYTYAITNYANAAQQQNIQANLYLYEDTLVAADLFCAGENGFIVPIFTE